MYQTQKATSEDVALIALAGSTGLEPATSDVTGRRSNQTELTPQADVRVCFRSRALRGLVYTEVCPPRNNFFEKIFGAIREGLRGWGRGLSLLLYSPAQDGKHIKCFPLRAELATNLTRPGPRWPQTGGMDQFRWGFDAWVVCWWANGYHTVVTASTL